MCPFVKYSVYTCVHCPAFVHPCARNPHAENHFSHHLSKKRPNGLHFIFSNTMHLSGSFTAAFGSLTSVRCGTWRWPEIEPSLALDCASQCQAG